MIRIIYIRVNQYMYDGVLTSVWILSRETGGFSIIIGLHEDSTLNAYLFTLIMDALTEHVQEIIPRCMFFCK